MAIIQACQLICMVLRPQAMHRTASTMCQQQGHAPHMPSHATWGQHAHRACLGHCAQMQHAVEIGFCALTMPSELPPTASTMTLGGLRGGSSPFSSLHLRCFTPSPESTLSPLHTSRVTAEILGLVSPSVHGQTCSTGDFQALPMLTQRRGEHGSALFPFTGRSTSVLLESKGVCKRR